MCGWIYVEGNTGIWNFLHLITLVCKCDLSFRQVQAQKIRIRHLSGGLGNHMKKLTSGVGEPVRRERDKKKRLSVVSMQVIIN